MMRSSETKIPGSKAGFTLLETLIAFTVFSVFLIAVHKSFVFGLKAQTSASWSNTLGQNVRSEFALIEAGLAPGNIYQKTLPGDSILRVEIEPTRPRDVSLPVDLSRLHLATITVLDEEQKEDLSFKKIINLAGE